MNEPSARIGITLGDPSGIGPEIIVKALATAPSHLCRRTVIFGDAGVLARAGGVPEGVRVAEVSRLGADESRPGAPSDAGAAAQVAYLEAAAAAARAGEIDALVTAPISKSQAKKAGFAFSGHTEFLATRLEAREHAMMFAGPRLRVVLATIHIPLREVPARLTADGIARAVALGGQAVARSFQLGRPPRIGVVGLNPHAGEGGLFGSEEKDIVEPGIAAGRKRLADDGVRAEVHGPLVPDVAFREAVEGRWDLLVALYHDQGLIPVKVVDFEKSVNVTLGLPIVRTSPDHGVAYDIAGKDRARATSFAQALALAGALAEVKRRCP